MRHDDTSSIRFTQALTRAHSPIDQISLSARRVRIICRKCNVEFFQYKGMRRWGGASSGIGYCSEHNEVNPKE